MTKAKHKKPSKNKELAAIIRTEEMLDELIDELLAKDFAVHDITVQGNPRQIEKQFGIKYIDPKFIEDDPKTPRKTPFMPEDFGWLVGFSFSIPLTIGLIIGAVIGGSSAPDIYNLSQIGYDTLTGGVIGGIVGLALAIFIKRMHDIKIQKQIEQGGFVIWVHCDSDVKTRHAKKMLKKYHAFAIHTKTLK